MLTKPQLCHQKFRLDFMILMLLFLLVWWLAVRGCPAFAFFTLLCWFLLMWSFFVILSCFFFIWRLPQSTFHKPLCSLLIYSKGSFSLFCCIFHFSHILLYSVQFKFDRMFPWVNTLSCKIHPKHWVDGICNHKIKFGTLHWVHLFSQIINRRLQKRLQYVFNLTQGLMKSLQWFSYLLEGNIWFSNEPLPGPEPILPRKLRSPYH